MPSPADPEKQPLLPSPAIEDEDEPTLAQLQQNVRHAQRAYIRAWSRTTSGRWHRGLMCGVTALLVLLMVFTMAVVIAQGGDIDSGLPRHRGGAERVPLEAHIMSKCPDAKDCLLQLVLPAMQEIGDRVDFRLSYIGRVTDDGGVVCMHGEDECLGNIIELCAQKEYPDPKVYLGFTMCLTREYQSIPGRELVDHCALEHGIDVEKLNKCSTDEDGYLAVDDLIASFNRTAAANVTKSCTIRLNNEVRCIRDGGKWTDCSGGHAVKDLVRDVIDLTSGLYM